MSNNDTSLSVLIEALERDLDIAAIQLGDEFFYNDLASCVIDSIYSIGVLYDGVVNTVRRYWRYQLGLADASLDDPRVLARTYGSPDSRIKASYSDTSLSDLTALAEKFSPDELAGQVFQNRQRTSSTNGILKAEAVVLAARVLLDNGVASFADVKSVLADDQRLSKLEKDFCCIKGQGSGIAIQYFLMLAGSNNHIKPDRMVLRYLENATGKPVTLITAQYLLKTASAELESRYPSVTPRKLDFAVWNHQRKQA